MFSVQKKLFSSLKGTLSGVLAPLGFKNFAFSNLERGADMGRSRLVVRAMISSLASGTESSSEVRSSFFAEDCRLLLTISATPYWVLDAYFRRLT